VLSELIRHGPAVRVLEVPKATIPLHAMVTAAGYERRANEIYSWEGSTRGPKPFAVLQHTIDGRGALDYAGTRHVLRPGDTMILTLPHRHRYWLEPGQSWEYFWLTVSGSEALRLVRAMLDLHGPVLRLGDTAVNRLAACCHRLVAEDDGGTGAVSAIAYDAIMAVYDGASSDAVAPEAAGPAFLQRVRRYIDDHLDAELGIETLAGVAQLSRAHFVRRFAEAVSVPPARYVLGRRLERARRLLVATDGSVADIAMATGFGSSNYFGKVFRRTYGLSPGTFRASRNRPDA
jgi:AraC family transcriptional regulator